MLDCTQLFGAASILYSRFASSADAASCNVALVFEKVGASLAAGIDIVKHR